MHDSLKKICKGLEKEFDEYAQHMSDGKLQMHEKDVERLKNLGMAMASLKLLKMLEGMKEDGEQQGGHGVGQFMDQIKKQGMGGMMNAIGMPTIPGFTPNIPYIEGPQARRGVPGTGRRSEYDDEYANWDDDDDMEMRRGVPGSGRGRRRRRAEYDGGMNMAYNAGGQGGSSGGQSGGQGGNSGGQGGNGGR